MIVTPLPIELKLPPSQGRSVGVHVSAIIRCVAIETGILKPQWAEELSLIDVREITDPEAVLRISIGLAWDTYYIHEVLGPMMGVAEHPPEIEFDGVYMSLDGESVGVVMADKERMELIVHEVKTTAKSTKTVGDLTSQFLWLSQCKAYALAKRTRFVMLHVLFLCGDYSFPIKPQLRVWQLEFTQAELDSNWDLLRDYRDSHMKGEE